MRARLTDTQTPAAHLAVNRVNGDESSDAFFRLSDQEREVLTLLANGKRNKEVAHVLGTGVRAIEAHRERLMQKLEVRGVAGLTKVACAKGLVSVDDYRF